MNFHAQSRIKKQLQNIIESQKLDGKFPHLGIYGISGNGKTLIAKELAKTIEAEMIYINATALVHPFVLVKEIQKAVKFPDRHHIIFLDEAHMLTKKIRESMLSVLEEPATLCCDVPSKITVRRQNSEEPITLKRGDIQTFVLPPNISFIFATTERGKIPHTLANRLIDIELDPYSISEQVEIAKSTVKKLQGSIVIPDFVLEEICSISRNIRDIKKYSKSFISLLVSHKRRIATKEDLEEWLLIQDIKDGLTKLDRKYLNVVQENQPVGIQQIASMMGVKKLDIIEKIEPYLLQKKKISITSKGRIIRRNTRKPEQDEEFIIAG